MASFQAIGFISSIKYQQDFCLVFVDEFKKGFRKKDGTIVADRYMQWKCIFKKGLVKYINDHFSNGMLVEVKGEVFPYAVEHDTTVDGYSVIGQTINMASFPRASARQEAAMIKDSQLHVNDIPDMEEYNKPDF